MFCKPPCPDEPEITTAPNDSNDRSGSERASRLGSHDAFGRSIAPETAGPEQGLPPASVRTG